MSTWLFRGHYVYPLEGTIQDDLAGRLHSDTLPDEAKKQLQMLQYVDGELTRLQAQAAVLQTARLAYANALKQALTPAANVLSGDTMKLN